MGADTPLRRGDRDIGCPDAFFLFLRCVIPRYRLYDGLTRHRGDEGFGVVHLAKPGDAVSGKAVEEAGGGEETGLQDSGRDAGGREDGSRCRSCCAEFGRLGGPRFVCVAGR